MTYRWREHVGPMFDHELERDYRTRAELEAWMERCPVKRSGERLVQLGLANAAALETMAASIQSEVDEAVARARIAPWPDPATLLERV